MQAIETTRLPLPRPSTGPMVEVAGEGLRAWQSNGGSTRGHPARALPHSFEVALQEAGELTRLILVGVFALFADASSEAPGTVGASVHLYNGKELVFRLDLLNGRHYHDGTILGADPLHPGDGSSLEKAEETEVDGRRVRLDKLTIDVPAGTQATTLRFKDLGSPASFLIVDILVESRKEAGCPFRARGGGIPLSELASIVRLGDRPRFERALAQLESSIAKAEDLDEARGQALLFLAVVSAATLELGAGKEMHRVQLEAARSFEECPTRDALSSSCLEMVRQVTESVMAPADDPASKIVDRALALVERNFARQVTDTTIAVQLGLSTSHFRFLFRQATGQPFHRYLVSLRLEKARLLLSERGLPVGAVAETVGFAGVSHFSRAFHQKFGVSPTSVRRFSA